MKYKCLAESRMLPFFINDILEKAQLILRIQSHETKGDRVTIAKTYYVAQERKFVAKFSLIESTPSACNETFIIYTL